MKHAPGGGSSTTQQMVKHWRQIIQGPTKSWVLFVHGTCVILMKPDSDLRKQATEIIREWGPVHGGSPAADFSVVHLDEYPGWVIEGHHPDILNYVAPSEVPAGSDDVAIGLLGRGKRHKDGTAPQAIHIEDKRGIH